MGLSHESIATDELAKLVNEQTKKVQDKIRALKEKGEEISIADMFELQMAMNRLAQLSEASTQVVGASHGALIAMARNIK